MPEQVYSYKLNFKVKKGYTGDIVAQCVEFPAIIVQGKTIKEISKEANTVLFAYLKAFPEEAKIFIEKYSHIKERTIHQIILEEVFRATKVKPIKKLKQIQTNWQQVPLLTVSK
jgi:predicted RNase H-like HicB family nuclease